MLAVVLRDYKPENDRSLRELEPSMSKMIPKDRLGACALSLVEVLVWGASDASCSRYVNKEVRRDSSLNKQIDLA